MSLEAEIRVFEKGMTRFLRRIATIIQAADIPEVDKDQYMENLRLLPPEVSAKMRNLCARVERLSKEKV